MIFLSNQNLISIKTGVEVLNGTFKEKYNDEGKINYNLITLKLIPTYKVDAVGFSLKASVRTFLSLDTENNVINTENNITNFFMFPTLFLQVTLFEKYLNVYGGFEGDLKTNTYKNFSEENPFVSPTLFITQTAETSNFFIGFKGNITRTISYNIKASTRKEEDKPLFLRNNSRFNSTISNSQILKGYEYGNSFKVFYDDVNTTSLFSEVTYVYNKNISLSSQVQVDNYKTKKALEIWNLPSLQGFLSAKYKTKKWQAIATIYYVNERKDMIYSPSFGSSFNSLEILNSFTDVNLNGEYHFNNNFSAFLKMNNVLNTKYQRFINFDTQGFQVLGGITYKFNF